VAVRSGGQTFTYAQLMGLWIRNGGSRAAAPIAAAIAEAESSGRDWVTSSNPDGGTNVGLWQLDTNGKGAGYSQTQLQDPATNARVAVTGSNDGRDWSAWETYADGDYRHFLSGRTTPDLSVPKSSASQQPTVATLKSYTPGECYWMFPGLPIPVLGNVGQVCLITKANARAVLGWGFVIAGAVIAAPSMGLLVAGAGLHALGPAGGAAEKTGGLVAFIPGAEGVGLGLAAAGRAAQNPTRAARSRRQRRQKNPPRTSGRGASSGP
jgi:Lysozyme like domain